MRKKEERDRAFAENTIPGILMLKDRSHLYDYEFDASNGAPATSFHAYQKIIQDQILHENKWHDRHFPSLATVCQDKIDDKVDESGCLYFGCHDDEDD